MYLPSIHRSYQNVIRAGCVSCYRPPEFHGRKMEISHSEIANSVLKKAKKSRNSALKTINSALRKCKFCIPKLL